MMEKWILEFNLQIKEALQIGEEATLKEAKGKLSNVLICGMGGSGIGGSIVAELVSASASVPINVNKNYLLPEYLNEQSLVIISSYSGNTEETISALNLALEKKAKVVCIASGGTIIEIAKKHNLDHILVPAGFLPRAALAYSVIQILFILSFHKIINSNFKKDILSSVDLLEKEEMGMQSEAKSIAKKINGKVPIIYAPALYEGVALRFQQDLNENAKVLSWHSVIPEMNHNELLGWRNENKEIAPIFIRTKDEYSHTSKRMEVTKGIISKKSGSVTEIWAKGGSMIEQTFYIIHFSSWISFFLAQEKGISADEMQVIDDLKKELAKL